MSRSFPSYRLRGFATTVVFGAAVAGFSAISAAGPGPASISVKYSDLDLSSRSGALVLYGRIQAAAKNACNYFWFKSDADEASCVQQTIANAVSNVHQPALSAVYDSKNKISASRNLVSQSH